MDIKTNNSLDLSINKDDLIDIMVDEELSRMEKVIDSKDSQFFATEALIEKINQELKTLVNNRLLKHLPKMFNPDDVESFDYRCGYPSCSVTFIFKDFGVVVKDLNTTMPKTAPFEIRLREIGNLKDKKEYLRKEISDLKEVYQKTEKSPKRLKAKLLTNFLSSSKEGIEVLNLVKGGSVKLIPAKIS